ncbi:hypothetical protein AVEN_31035-1 [Araneus ventricosus]|uniref:Retroviral polymerase SH3-like domain-containing protein n=1 Tax=Araneus ventricosus TaxID=182803 RepID=A0A4Y2WW22_ARAVE|nr:hypothetical protein AVEN_31035-1 [Araneus ventricosus]
MLLPVQKRKKMDKKAVKGYLVRYEGDERYRIWLKEENRVILSRDVIFHEKPSRCVQQMLKEPYNEEKHAEEKLDEKEQEPANNAEDDSEENEQEMTIIQSTKAKKSTNRRKEWCSFEILHRFWV